MPISRKFVRATRQFQNPEFSKKIDQIEHVVRTIFERAAERPEVIDDLDHLMDYYLPTTGQTS